MKTITVAGLKKRGACPISRRLFQKTFGKGRVKFTVENAKRACEAGLPSYWASLELLDKNEHRRYETLCEKLRARYYSDINYYNDYWGKVVGWTAFIAAKNGLKLKRNAAYGFDAL